MSCVCLVCYDVVLAMFGVVWLLEVVKAPGARGGGGKSGVSASA